MRTPLTPGSTLGAFTLVRPTGAGGFAQVWLAEDENTSRVALKVLAPADGTASALQRDWFRREYAVGQAVRSRFVASPFAAGLESDPMWMAFPFVEGTTLRRVLDEQVLDRDSIGRLGAQMAQGLADIHAHGLVHRDIKPSNIMVSPGQRVTILDLGVVHDPESTALTGLHQPGTIGYLAPESASATVTAAADVWALSVILTQMVSPGSPVHCPLEEALVDVDPGWAALIRSCQAQDPAARPDAAAVVDWIAQGPDESFVWHEGAAQAKAPEPTVVAAIPLDDGAVPAAEAGLDEPGPEDVVVDGVPKTRRPSGRALAVAAVALSVMAGMVTAVNVASGAGSAELPTAPSSPSAEPSTDDGDQPLDSTRPSGAATRPVSPGWDTRPSTSTPTAEPSVSESATPSTETSDPSAPAPTLPPGSPSPTPSQETPSPAPPAQPTTDPEAPTPTPAAGQ